MATITKRGNSYLIRVSAGYDVNGRQIKKNMTWTPPASVRPSQIEKELTKQAILFEEKVANNRSMDPHIRFSEFAEKWMKSDAAGRLAPKTMQRYEMLLGRINQSIGNIQIDRLQPHHLVDFYLNLAEDGVRQDSKYLFNDLKKIKEDQGIKKIVDFAKKVGLATNTVSSALSNKPVSKTTVQAVAKAFKLEPSEIAKEIEGKINLSDRTVLHHHRLISSILQTAVHWGIITSNPASRVKAPSVKRSESKYLDEVQAKKLIELLETAPIQYRTMILLLIYSGIRRGELCGLDWHDVDFKNHVLHINRTSQYVKGKGIFDKDTKTEKSARSIKLSPLAFTALNKYKQWQKKEMLKRGHTWTEDVRLFTKDDDTPIHPDTISKWFHEFIEYNGLPAANIHSLRHTNATLMIASGVDIRTVSSRLGHSQTSTTMDIYSHAIQSADAAAAETIANILQPTENREKAKKKQKA